MTAEELERKWWSEGSRKLEKDVHGAVVKEQRVSRRSSFSSSKGKKEKERRTRTRATTPINGVLIWTNNTESTFINGNLSLINNEVHINQKGLYFVYTQVTFEVVTCPKLTSFLLSHAVILKSIRQEAPIQLLHAQKTVCEEKKAGQSTNGQLGLGWRKSIFQGGVFQLEKGDKLYTHTSEMSYLLGLDGATYFGLYAL
ncbi:PREDICTED: lymphotoxin-alpha-like [Nanorana parkeri]|uniref:lymphotoxin-alpha-like n=1 Tax=Nanorana parkeri TaxID=125878 RepID=UPI000855051A|nr:PREDICTED: lymphotoxin-alpha-like [Nanorana parkeri]